MTYASSSPSSGGMPSSAAAPSASAARITLRATPTLTSRTTSTPGSSGAVGSRSAGLSSATASTAATSMASVTRSARQSTEPRPIPGNTTELLHSATSISTSEPPGSREREDEGAVDVGRHGLHNLLGEGLGHGGRADQDIGVDLVDDAEQIGLLALPVALVFGETRLCGRDVQSRRQETGFIDEPARECWR